MIYIIEYTPDEKQWTILPASEVPGGVDLEKVRWFRKSKKDSCQIIDWCKIYLEESKPEYALKRARFLVEKSWRKSNE